MFSQLIEGLKTRIAEHSRKFVKHLVGKQEGVFAVNDADEQFAGKTLRVLVGSHQNGGVENDLH